MTDKANIQLMLALYLKKAFNPKTSVNWEFLPTEYIETNKMIKLRLIKLARYANSAYLTRLGRILVAGEIIMRKQEIKKWMRLFFKKWKGEINVL